jgi:hypothetical protein
MLGIACGGGRLYIFFITAGSVQAAGRVAVKIGADKAAPPKKVISSIVSQNAKKAIA